MAAPATVNVCKINASNITFSEVKKNKQGGGSVSFKYTNQNVQFRFPQFAFPGGVLVKDNQNKDGSVTTSYTMSASLQGCDPYGVEPAAGTDDVQKAYNFLREFQEAVIKAAVDNSPKWFGKKREIGSIRDSFNKFLRTLPRVGSRTASTRRVCASRCPCTTARFAWTSSTTRTTT